MIYLAVCDDNRAHLAYACDLILKNEIGKQAVIEQYDNANAMLLSMSNGEFKPDIAILDIVMKDVDGISLAKSINAIDPYCQIIFLTAYLPYATQVYDVEHVYFILKSEMEQRLSPALQKALQKRALALREQWVVRTATGAVTIPRNDIFYLERVVRKTNIVMRDGTIYTTTQTPQTLLKDDARPFIRSHKSFYVNPANIYAMEQTAFTLTNGVSVPISRTFHSSAREAFFGSFRTQNHFE